MLKDYPPGMRPAQKKEEMPMGRRPDGGMTYSLPKPPSSAPRQESPYDIVGGYRSPGVTYLGRPRWEVENERRRAEREEEMAQIEMEYRRWILEQQMANPHGANVRDLIYGAGK